MFKKFKDKLAEEMKQSPARLQASVQQLAQAVVSPALSNSSIQEVSTSNDNFSLTEDGDETPKNTPKHSFQNVDLMSPSPNRLEISRRSSVSSVTSDASSLFPMYESPPNLYHLQSDMDQSASEVDDNISPHLDRVTKDQLYSAYRKVQAKYHKYRGRYTDLATHYRELDRTKSRLESVLVETQDKVLRRITDLKEQCQLEQQAKAHLEEALRNDIEEKDHIINTLNTKVRLLQASGPTLENSAPDDVEQRENSKDNLIDLSANESPDDDALSAENAQLKDKLKKLENLILKYKESLKRNKDKFTEVMREKNALDSDYETLKTSSAEALSAMEGELSAARARIDQLAEQVDIMQKREEEAAISLAENKLSVHRELEEKEEQIKQLRIDLKHMTEDKEKLSETLANYKNQLVKPAESSVDRNTAANNDAAKEAKGKEEVDYSEDATSEKGELEPTLRLREMEIELEQAQRKLDELEKQNVEYKHEKDKLNSELTVCRSACSELKNQYDAQRIVTEERRKEADSKVEKLQATVQSVDKELENMRNALIDRDQVCENYRKKVQQCTGMFEKAKQRLTEQEAQIKSLQDRHEEDSAELSKLREELTNRNAELSAAQSELGLCRSAIDDLQFKVQADSSAISLLKKERIDLINRIIYYNGCVRRLKQDCADIGTVVREELSGQKAGISALHSTLVAHLARQEEENGTLRSEVDELRSKTKSAEDLEESEELRSELTRIASAKATLEAELKSANEQLSEMKLRSDRYDELSAMNNKLIADIDNLTFKLHDADKISRQLTQAAEVNRERLKALENLESINRALSDENGDLRGECAKLTDDVGSLREELRASRTEIERLREDLTARESAIASRDEKLASDEEHIAHLKSTCDSHIQTIEEHVKKYLNLEQEYQAVRATHAKETAELMESNKVLQETLNVKIAQLKKMKAIKDQQSKTVEGLSAELDELKTERAKMSDALKAFEERVESLKLENSQIASENKDLKDEHNEVVSRNRKLCENEEALKRKIADCEKDVEELRGTLRSREESHASQLNYQREETERLNEKLATVNGELERANSKLSSLNERLMTNESELEEIKGRLDERNAELRNKITELDAAVTNADAAKQRSEQLAAELKSLREEVERVKDLEDENAELRSRMSDLIEKSSDAETIRSENSKLTAELEIASSSNAELQARVNSLQSEISSLEERNERLHSDVDALRSAETPSAELNALKRLLAEKEAEVKLLEDKNSNMSQEIANLRHFSLEVDERRKEMNVMRNSLALAEEKAAGLQSEIDSLARKNDELSKELESVRDDENTKSDSDRLREENKRLEGQLDEALITFQAKETQMQLAANELRTQASQLREQLKTSEEEQGMRLKQLVKEFQAQLHDKEEELQAALEKRFDRQHNYESNLVQQYKEQLKDCQTELSEKSEQLESLALEKRDEVAEKGQDIDRLVETIAQIKNEHINEIKELEKKWKAIVQQKIDSQQTKHDEELNELTKEWQNERKSGAQPEAVSAEELESTSRVAMAAVQTSTGSIHTLQQTLTSQRRELAELRKLVKLRHDTLEDSTEIEYLRNILFEYMMGRETMVLARVIAAVVKFDQEQTAKILKKEEDKLTLLGSLGLS